MRVVYQSFEGRYSDNPRALYEKWVVERPGDDHIWFADPAHRSTFPPDVDTVVPYSPECRLALESADLLIANTHTDMEWAKRPETTYLQTWHGTPLKRVHSDVLWAPPGRLNRLDRDIGRWDVLLSPNAASTPRLRQAFGYSAEVLESGYPRNDVLLSPDADARRRRVRADLGLDDGTVAVLYTPTWRDDAVFSEAQAPLPIRLQLEELVRQLGPGYTVLVRVHSMETDRHARVERPGVRDVSFHADVAELYLAADAMITDYSSTMFDFAVTGKPLLFYAYDYERFRDEVRGFYFDLEDEAPGPLLPDEDHLAHALRDLDEVRRTHAVEYAAFRRRYCALEDGRATERVLERMWKT